MKLFIKCYMPLLLFVTLSFSTDSEAFQRLHLIDRHRVSLLRQHDEVCVRSNKVFLSIQKNDHEHFEHSHKIDYGDRSQSDVKNNDNMEEENKRKSTVVTVAKNVVLLPKPGLKTIVHRLVVSVRKVKSKASSSRSLPLLASTVVAMPSAAATTTIVTPSRMIYGSIIFLVISCMVFLVTQRERILYPGSNKMGDPSYKDVPIPSDGTLDGCPFFGPLRMYSNFNQWFSTRSAQLGNSNFFKLYSIAKPSVMLSGSKLIKELLDKEFITDSSSGVGKVIQFLEFGASTDLLFGSKSMSGVTEDKREHQALRKLVGESMTPKSLRLAVPALQEAVEMTLDGILEEAAIAKDGSVRIKNYMHQFTQDVAWKQIIGLNLGSLEEIEEFRTAMNIWMTGLTNFFLLSLPPFIAKHSKPVKAKRFLDQVVEKKIDELQQNGKASNDGTALSAMVYADVEDSGGEVKRLSKEEIVDNTSLLLLAGSETTANTLTNLIYMLGMNKNVWYEIIREQEKIISEKGIEIITKDLLDNECPYLTAVVNEALRLKPISAGGIRLVDETTILDGKQIPKGWLAYFGLALTHEQDPITYRKDGSHMDLVQGFKPERWLDETTRPTTEFVPFGAGNRFCLGYALALLEMKLFLAVMARRKIDFELVHESIHPNKQRKWKEGIILTPADGSRVYIKQNQS